MNCTHYTRYFYVQIPETDKHKHDTAFSVSGTMTSAPRRSSAVAASEVREVWAPAAKVESV